MENIFASPPTANILIAGQNVITGNDDCLSYMYDEYRYGAVPTQEAAQKLLADLKAGKAWLHPISETGCMDRLEDIAVGRTVDPTFWQHMHSQD